MDIGTYKPVFTYIDIKNSSKNTLYIQVKLNTLQNIMFSSFNSYNVNKTNKRHSYKHIYPMFVTTKTKYLLVDNLWIMVE